MVLVLVIAFGCVTQKKRGERSALGKLYENTTARYNGYYNATVLLQESLLALEQQHQDNYNALLPLYPYMAVDNARSVSSQLDEAIKKVSTVVALHRSSRWTDDCYLLMGKAQFLKQDYESAEETLEYLVEEFPPDNPVQEVAPEKRKPS
ncbi:MAG: gliding motility protein, partial [Bacteroidetes bacterium]